MRSTRGVIAAPARWDAGAAPTPARRLRLAVFMAGIQYSTALTEATAPAGDFASPSIHEAAAPLAKHPLAIPRARPKPSPRPQSPAARVAKKPPAGVSRFTGTHQR